MKNKFCDKKNQTVFISKKKMPMKYCIHVFCVSNSYTVVNPGGPENYWKIDQDTFRGQD